jgi:hypothetical protein
VTQTIIWENFWSYHTGFVPGPILLGNAQFFTHNQSSISIFSKDNEEIETVAIKGKLADICVSNSSIIYVSSGAGYRYSKDSSDHSNYIRDEGVELSDALNSAKGFLFGLRKTLGDSVKRVKPRVNQVKGQVQQTVTEVSKQISKELFDDDVYVPKDIEQGVEAVEIIEEVPPTVNIPPISTDTTSHNTPIKVNRLIKKKIQIAKPKSSNNSKEEIDPNIYIEKSTSSSNSENEQSFEEEKESNIEMEEEILRAFQKLDQNIQVDTRPIQNILIASQPVQIAENILKKDPDEIISSPQSNNSWVVLESEHDEI